MNTPMNVMDLLDAAQPRKRWTHTVSVKHLFTEEEDWDSVQNSMNKIADVLEGDEWFKDFSLDEFRDIPKRRPVLYANDLLNDMYNYADENRIWIK